MYSNDIRRDPEKGFLTKLCKCKDTYGTNIKMIFLTCGNGFEVVLVELCFQVFC